MCLEMRELVDDAAEVRRPGWGVALESRDGWRLQVRTCDKPE
jgi:hypothetical protein